MFKLSHDVFSQRLGQVFAALGIVLGEEHRCRGKASGPTVLADGGEEPVEQPGVAALVLRAEFPVQVAEFADERIGGGPIGAIVDRDCGSLGGEPSHDRGADSAAAAGDRGALALET